MMLLCSISKNS